ncbi:hypothetical protein [Aeromonas encheleia]|uniref:hypothetical protein n=1 Tax=Aeromonas encheleia TaxID=73010 RepID=UPI003BF599D3
MAKVDCRPPPSSSLNNCCVCSPKPAPAVPARHYRTIRPSIPVSSRPAFWPATSPAIQDGQSRPSQPIASRTMAELARLAGRSDHGVARPVMAENDG